MWSGENIYLLFSDVQGEIQYRYIWQTGEIDPFCSGPFRCDDVQSGRQMYRPHLPAEEDGNGAGATVDASMKNATTGMSRWLAGSHGLMPKDIAAVLARR